MIYIHDPAELSEAAQEAGRLVCQRCGHIFGDTEDYYDTEEGTLCEPCARELAEEIMEDWKRYQ